MDESDPLKARLDAINEKIGKARDRLKLQGLFDKGHEATSEELTQRYQMLSAKLDAEMASLAAHGEAVNSLEKTVLIWVNGLGFD